MASLEIRSRLKHFKLVSRIRQVSAAGIQGEADFERTPFFGGLEALAQLAALHVRHRLDFGRLAFLLKVNHAHWTAPAALEPGCLEGCFRLQADVYSQSSNAFAYRAKALGAGQAALHADLIIGTKPYDREFQEDLLKDYYRELFKRLQ